MPKITIKAARVNADMTQAEVAEKLSIAPSTRRRYCL